MKRLFIQTAYTSYFIFWSCYKTKHLHQFLLKNSLYWRSFGERFSLRTLLYLFSS